MGFGTHVKALLAKDYYQTKHGVVSRLLQIGIPFGMMTLLLFLSALNSRTWNNSGPDYEMEVFPIDTTLSFYTMGDLANYGSMYTYIFSQDDTEFSRWIGVVNSTMGKVVAEYLEYNLMQVKLFPSEEAMRDYAIHSSKNTSNGRTVFTNLTAGIAFDEEKKGESYRYRLFINRNYITDVSENFVDSLHMTPAYDEFNGTLISGILYLKSLVDSIILQQETLNPSANIIYGYAPMKYQAYQSGRLGQYTDTIISFFFLASIMAPFVGLIGQFMEDKTSRMRDTMKILGLTDSAYFFGCFISYAAFEFIISFFVPLLAFFFLYDNTNYFLFSLFIFFFGLSLYPFAFIISAIFKSRITARIIGLFMLFLLALLPMPHVMGYHSQLWLKLILSFFPQIAFFLGLEVFARAEDAGKPITFSSFLITDSYGYTLYYAYIFFLLDFVIFMLIALYLDNVLPSMSGFRKPFYYFLTPSYWGCRSGSPPQEESTMTNPLIAEEEKTSHKESIDTQNFESVSGSLDFQYETNQTIKLQGLHKVYGKGNVAVDQISFDLFTGQIFALIGHNGAGKTTTLSMLIGMVHPDKGKVTAFGKNMLENISEFKGEIGVCPQEDALFSELTVEEHLEVIGRFKELSPIVIRDNIQRLLFDLKLIPEQNVPAGQLSSGSKRKLSLAMAMMGNPRILLLDEPTVGMDMSMKQEIWKILAKYKRDRIVILTTQFMDEADKLADRIGIMIQGKLICCGSSMFLKKRYGIGYHMNIVKREEVDLSEDIILFVKKYIPEAEVTLRVNEQIEFKIPFVGQEKYQTLFTELEMNLDNLGIRAYGVWITTLEDVFLKVGERDGEIIPHWKVNLFKSSHKLSEESSEHYSISEKSEPTHFEQLGAIIMKKILESSKSLHSLIFILLIPVILCLLGIASYKSIITPSSHFYNIGTDFPNSTIYVNNYTCLYNASSADLLDKFAEQNNANLKFVNLPESSTTRQHIIDLAEIVDARERTYKKQVFGNFLLYEFNHTESKAGVISLFDVSIPQSALAYTQAIGKYMIKSMCGVTVESGITQMRVSNTKSEALETQTQVSLFTGSFSISMGLIPGLLALYLLRERREELKQHLLTSGLSLWVYWLGYYLIDTLCVYFPVLLIIIICYAFSTSIYYSTLFLLLFPPAQVSFVYFTSVFFSNESILYAINTFFHIICGAILPILVMVMRIYKSTAVTSIILAHIFSFIPSFSAVWGISIIACKDVLNLLDSNTKNIVTFGSENDLNDTSLYQNFSWNIGLQPLIFLVISPFIYLALLGFFEYTLKGRQERRAQAKKLPEYPHKYSKDEEVRIEEEAIEQANPEEYSVICSNLTKGYRCGNEMKIALHKVTFGVSNHEVFTVLGQNASGKTSLLKVLSNTIPANEGQIFLDGERVTSNSAFSIGYCPQFNTIFENLTVERHLNMYAAIKGIPVQFREEMKNMVLSALELELYRNHTPETLSVGTKRKLTIAIALLGQPSILLLDEPSNGIDPRVRRAMWHLIAQTTQKWEKSALVLATNSLDEAEALSNRLAILINGTFRCLGNPFSLKSKYAIGYDLEIDFCNPTSEQTKIFLDSVGINLGIEDLVDFRTLQQILSDTNMAAFGAKISENGELSDLYFRLSTELSVPIKFIAKLILFDRWRDQTLYTITRQCGETQVTTLSPGHYKYRVSLSNISVAKMFGVIEELKERIPVHNYSVLQPTLDEVFHQFVELGEQEVRQASEAQNAQDDADSEEGEEDDE